MLMFPARPIVCQHMPPKWGHVSLLRRGRPLLSLGDVRLWQVGLSIDGVQQQERPPCIERVGKVFLQAMGPGQGLRFSLVGIGRKGLGIALHICSFVCLGLLEIHLETRSDGLFWRCARGDSAGSVSASLAPASRARGLRPPSPGSRWAAQLLLEGRRLRLGFVGEQRSCCIQGGGWNVESGYASWSSSAEGARTRSPLLVFEPYLPSLLTSTLHTVPVPVAHAFSHLSPVPPSACWNALASLLCQGTPFILCSGVCPRLSRSTSVLRHRSPYLCTRAHLTAGVRRGSRLRNPCEKALGLTRLAISRAHRGREESAG